MPISTHHFRVPVSRGQDNINNQKNWTSGGDLFTMTSFKPFMSLNSPDRGDEITDLSELNVSQEVLAAIGNLEDPKIYGLNNEGFLMVGDGHIPVHTLGMTYTDARQDAEAKGLSLLRFPHNAVIKNLRNGSGADFLTWTECGEASVEIPAIYIGYENGAYVEHNKDPNTGAPNLGALRMCYIDLSTN